MDAWPKGVKAWYVDAPKFEPVKGDGFIGAVESGAPVNFRNIFFNPHGHGTHTECLGHITEKIHSVNEMKLPLFLQALLVTVVPKVIGSDAVITPSILKEALKNYSDKYEALVIRTLPNDGKKEKNYSNSNPPFLEIECCALMDKLGIKHLLIDTPSVDKEQDEGVLAFHHAFWKVPDQPCFDKTITELIFVPDTILDGNYLLNLQLAPFENDAAPSRPMLYPIQFKMK